MSSNKMRIKVTRAEAKVCDMMDGNRRCQIKFLLFSLANVSAWILLLIFSLTYFGWSRWFARLDWCLLNLKRFTLCWLFLIYFQCDQIAPQKRLSVHFKSFWKGFKAEKSSLSFYVNFNIISRSFIIINQYYGARREIFSCSCLLHRHRRCRRYTIDRSRHLPTSFVSRLHLPLSFSTHSIEE